LPLYAPTAPAEFDAHVAIATPRPVAERLTKLLKGPLLFASIILVCVALQHRFGAYVTERGNYSDESTHLMNGLLLRDYLREGLGSNPLEFARTYYLNYPKIAPGMWPPLFHIVLGLLLLFTGAPQATALLFVGVAAAWTGWRLWTIVHRLAGATIATIVTLFFLTTPALVDMTSVVMLDALVAAMTLEATWWLTRYFATGRRSHAITFGVLAALCCLTKGNGIAIVLTPALFAILTWRPRAFRDPGLWLAAAIVLVVAFPLVLFSARLDAAIGDFGPVPAALAAKRFLFYTGHLVEQLGGVITLLGFAGIVIVVLRQTVTERAEDAWLGAGLSALVLSTLLFHIFNPHQVIAGRYILMAMAPMVALATSMLLRLTTYGSGERGRRLCAALLVIVCAWAMGRRPEIVSRRPLGWRTVVGHLWRDDGLSGQRLLVVSDETGEGAFVSEVAIEGPLPRATVIRGSKLLATDDWNGHAMRLTFTSPEALAQELEDLHVSSIVLDMSSRAQALPYYDLVTAAAERAHAELTYSGDGERPIKVYRLARATAGPPKKLVVAVSGPLPAIVER
jgi:hypothetical protein